jgi:predicted nuclease of predicted toxin-antitoxin system
MRILLDECLPKQLKSVLQRHEVLTTGEAGWAGRRNGELLRLAQGQYDVILTVDQRFLKHPDSERKTVAVIILRARSNSLESLLPLVPDLLTSLETIQPGETLTLA